MRALPPAFLALTLGACLVTDRLDPPVLPNAPPVIFDVTEPANTEPISAEDITTVDATMPGSLDFEIEVQDLNVTQTLAVVALLDLPGDNRSVAYVNENLEPQGGAIARRETIRVDVSLLRPPPGSTSCRRLTVFASSGFERIDIGQPIEPGDLARAVYWLRVVDPPEQEVDLTECP